ncbi:MAG: helix-turn-helix transcriptional regulator [Gemmatimonadetes bacterium]|nr:helix-turn-helix transcriptional regulator [Gemmatimonadota bacterium]
MRPIEVTAGSGEASHLAVGPFRVSIADFEPDLRIPMHYHDWACVSVLLSGQFEQRFPGRSCECPPGVVLAKPPAERHEDRWYSTWSRHLIIEIDPERHEELGPVRSAVERISHVHAVGAESLAWAAWKELVAPDSVTPVAIESIVLQLLSRLQRRSDGKMSSVPPQWLATALEFVHDNYRSPIRLADVAVAAGVSPDHLARVFGTVKGTTIGGYLRTLRVEKAAALLLGSSAGIAEIAYKTGFSDQSHLTRVFKRAKGITPGRFRSTQSSDPL